MANEQLQSARGTSGFGATVIRDSETFAVAQEMMDRSSDAPAPPFERRRSPRRRYYAQATLTFDEADPVSCGPTLYVRDVSVTSVGFITGVKLPPSGRAVIALPSPAGQLLRVKCVICRCRAFAPRWYEGAVRFEKEQPAFAVDGTIAA